MYGMILFAADPFGTQGYLRRGGSLEGNWFLIIAVLAIGLFWVGVYLWDKYRKKSIGNTDRPKSLFLELCQAHELNRTERNLLLQAAESKGLEQTALMFLDRNIVGEFANASTPDAAVFDALLLKLFGAEQLQEIETVSEPA